MPDIDNSRLVRLMVCTLGFNYEVQYINGGANTIADIISRNTVAGMNSVDDEEHQQDLCGN